jgi:hypothetical protein
LTAGSRSGGAEEGNSFFKKDAQEYAKKEKLLLLMQAELRKEAQKAKISRKI